MQLLNVICNYFFNIVTILYKCLFAGMFINLNSLGISE